MNTDKHGLMHEDLTGCILRVFYQVYNEMGFGYFESVYENCLAIALEEAGLRVERQVRVPVYFRGRVVGDFVADLVINGVVLLELKSVRTIDTAHEAQLLNYLKATPIEVGLLLNFGLKPQIRRLIFDNPRKSFRAPPDPL